MKIKFPFLIFFLLTLICFLLFFLSYKHTEVIYQINQKQAFQAASSFMGLNGKFVGKIPVPSVSCIMGDIKGFQSIYKFKDEKYIQKILIFPVTGINFDKDKIYGFKFEVIGDDISGYRSIEQIRKKISAKLEKDLVEVKDVEQSEYDNYGFEEISRLDEIIKNKDFGTIYELGDQCVISSYIVSSLANYIIKSYKGESAVILNSGKGANFPKVFDIAREFDEFFYNINYGQRIEDTDLLFPLRKKIYDRFIEVYQLQNNIFPSDIEIKSYEDYLLNNVKGVKYTSKGFKNLIKNLAKKGVLIWNIHKELYVYDSGPVSIKEGWLPVSGYLKKVNEYVKKEIIKFPNETTKNNFFNFYENEKKNSKININLIETYYQEPWWEMDKETRNMYLIDKYVEIK